MGLSVLLVDADPQGSLSQAFLGSEAVESLKSSQTLAAIFNDDTLVNFATLCVATHCRGISLIPSNQCLANYNVTSPEKCRMQQFELTQVLDALCGYDLMLID